MNSCLPGQTLQQLLNAVEEFLHYHRQIDEEICEENEDVDVKASFIRRLQGVVDELRTEFMGNIRYEPQPIDISKNP